MDRLQKFRELLARMDPTVPALGEHYVAQPARVGLELARTLQVDPTSSLLLVGSIGCGKTTELLVAAEHLIESSDLFAVVMDVAAALEPDTADGEALTLAVLDDLRQMLPETVVDDPVAQQLAAFLEPLVEGGVDEWWDLPDEEHPGAFGPRLVRPRPNVPESVAGLHPALEMAVDLVHRHYGRKLVWLLDGLDRIASPIAFDKVVIPFLRSLKHVGIGVAMVGPRRSIAGTDRLGAAAEFDYLYRMGPLDTSKPSAGFDFLMGVLLARGVQDMVSQPCLEQLIHWSGGALRILLQLTREAIKETWVRNAIALGSEQVEAAADRVGRSLLLGLTDSEIMTLRRLHDSKLFPLRTEEESALVLTNRVLEYRTERGLEHRLHPTLVKFVETFDAPEASTKLS